MATAEPENIIENLKLTYQYALNQTGNSKYT